MGDNGAQESIERDDGGDDRGVPPLVRVRPEVKASAGRPRALGPVRLVEDETDRCVAGRQRDATRKNRHGDDELVNKRHDSNKRDSN